MELDPIFPAGQAQAIGRDQILIIITETRTQVQSLEKALTTAFLGLKSSIEEMVDRLEADADDMKEKISGLGELTTGSKDHTSRILILEKIVRDQGEWQVKADTTMKVVGAVAGLGGGVLGVLVGHFWK